MNSDNVNFKNTKTKSSAGWILLLVGAVLLVAGCIVIIAWQLNWVGATPANYFLRVQGGLDGDHLLVSWPEKQVSVSTGKRHPESGEFAVIVRTFPAANLHIPKEYLDAGGTYYDKNKKIEELSLGFELPGPTPFKNHPELKFKRDTPEYAEFKLKWLGRFFLKLQREIFHDPDTVRFRISSKVSGSYYMRDGSVAGLVRYSQVACLSERGGDGPDFVKFIQQKESDDPTPPGCRANRFNVELVSPPGTDDEEHFVSIRCTGGSGYMYFNVLGRKASISVNLEDIPRWQNIVSSARGLVGGFVVAESTDFPAKSATN